MPRAAWLPVALASLALVAVLANAALLLSNRQLQADLNQRSAYLQQSAQMELLYRDMARSLAELAVRSNDQALLKALQSLGLSVTVNPGSAAPGASHPAAKP
jgi:hypothetical protein